MTCKSFELFFTNFSNKTKLAIILALKEQPLCVNDLAQKINQEQSKVSHNLRKLAQCNIITAEQQGKQRIYSLNKDTVIPLLQLVEKHVKCHCQRCPK